MVNGLPQGHRFLTVVNACGCAGGPTTTMFERYSHGAFVRAHWPGRTPSCSVAAVERVVDFAEVRVLRFTRVGCADGWALAVGDGAGLTGPLVALFNLQGLPGRATWDLQRLDNGNALPSRGRSRTGSWRPAASAG